MAVLAPNILHPHEFVAITDGRVGLLLVCSIVLVCSYVASTLAMCLWYDTPPVLLIIAHVVTGLVYAIIIGILFYGAYKREIYRLERPNPFEPPMPFERSSTYTRADTYTRGGTYTPQDSDPDS